MNHVPARLKSSGPVYHEPLLQLMKFQTTIDIVELTENEMGSCKYGRF